MFCMKLIALFFHYEEILKSLATTERRPKSQLKTKRHREKTKESDEARTKKRKLHRVAETRAHWTEMEKSGKSFESWQQSGFKTPTKPKKPKPKPKKKQ